MTIEPSLAFRMCPPCDGKGKEFAKDEPCRVCFGERYVPDGRLQAIADAPKCEHGNVYPHPTKADRGYSFGYEQCGGAPELMTLLDALTEEER